MSITSDIIIVICFLWYHMNVNPSVIYDFMCHRTNLRKKRKEEIRIHKKKEIFEIDEMNENVEISCRILFYPHIFCCWYYFTLYF